MATAKGERLKALGADDVIDYHRTPEWGHAARELTGGRGVDRIVEVGGAATFAQSLVAGNGHAEIDAIGFLGTTDWGLDFMDLFNGGFDTIRRIRVGSRQDTESLVRLLAQHPLEPVTDSVYPFAQALNAWHHFDTARTSARSSSPCEILHHQRARDPISPRRRRPNRTGGIAAQQHRSLRRPVRPRNKQGSQSDTPAPPSKRRRPGRPRRPALPARAPGRPR
jgi:hypothetical protein